MMRYVIAAIVGAVAGYAYARAQEDNKGDREEGYRKGYDEAWAEQDEVMAKAEADFREAVNSAPDSERICRAALAYALTQEKTGELPTAIRRKLDERLNPEGDAYLAAMFDQLATIEALDVDRAMAEFTDAFGAERAHRARAVIESWLDHLIRVAGTEVSAAMPNAIIFQLPT